MKPKREGGSEAQKGQRVFLQAHQIVFSACDNKFIVIGEVFVMFRGIFLEIIESFCWCLAFKAQF